MKRSTKIRIRHQGASMLFYPAALPLSSRTLTYPDFYQRHGVSRAVAS
jgi:hypothetical protein